MGNRQPLVGEGWGEGEHTESTKRHPWHLALLQRWVNENPPGHGNGWEPYPTSLRIVNWIKWSLTFATKPGGVPAVLPPACLQSLAVQARWLSSRLEHHLLGNHLFANAKALVYAGAFFVGPEADRWRHLGLRLLARELDEQILPDGGHFERSPMYHAILLEDVLDLINLAGAYPGLFGAVGSDAVDGIDAVAGVNAETRANFHEGPATPQTMKASTGVFHANWHGSAGHTHGYESQSRDFHANATVGATAVSLWRAKASAMLNWLATMTHPDGEISFFNDAAFGIAPKLADVVRYADVIFADRQAQPIPSVIPVPSLVIPAGKPESSAMEGSAAVVRRVGAELSRTVPGLGPGFPAGTTGDGGHAGPMLPGLYKFRPLLKTAD